MMPAVSSVSVYACVCVHALQSPGALLIKSLFSFFLPSFFLLPTTSWPLVSSPLVFISLSLLFIYYIFFFFYISISNFFSFSVLFSSTTRVRNFAQCTSVTHRTQCGVYIIGENAHPGNSAFVAGGNITAIPVPFFYL